MTDRIRLLAAHGASETEIARSLGVSLDEVRAALTSGKPTGAPRGELPPPPEAPEVEHAPATYPRTIGELNAWLNPGAQPAPRIHGQYAAVGRRSGRILR